MRKFLYTLCLFSIVLFLTGCNSKEKPTDNRQETTSPVPKEIMGTKVGEMDYLLDLSPEFHLENYLFYKASLYSEELLLVINTHLTEDKVMLRLYNPYTQEFIKESSISFGNNAESMDYFQTKILADGRIAIYSWNELIYYFLDKDFTSVTECKLDSDCSYIDHHISKDGKFIYYYNCDNKKLFSYNMETGTTSEISIDSVGEITYLAGLTDNGKYLVARIQEPFAAVYGIINLETKELSRFDSHNHNIDIVENTFVYYPYFETLQERKFINPDTPRLYKCFKISLSEDNSFINTRYPDSSSFITINESYEDDKYLYTWNYYDINSGTLNFQLTNATDDMYSVTYTEKSSDGKYIFIMDAYAGDEGMGDYDDNYIPPDKNKFYVWILNKSPEATEDFSNFEITSKKDDIIVNTHTPDEPLYTLYQKAYNLSKEYGINIFVGEDGAKTVSYYTSPAVTDYDTINEALDTLKELFDKYPKGIMSNMHYNTITGLDIYLCGNIERTSTTVAGNVDAYAAVVDDRHVIVADINCSNLSATIAHEISHVMDKKILCMAEALDRDFEEEWNALNPKDFSYINAYVDSNGNHIFYDALKYTPNDPDSYGDVAKIYFIDGYAQTYPTEDRARLFEYIIRTQDYIPYYMHSPHIIKKYKLMNEWIKLTYNLEDTALLDDHIERLESPQG